MQIKQLAYFTAVVEYGSFSKAATALYMAQSSLSQSVMELESELGFSLLTRSRGGAALTEMGKSVYADSKKILKEIDSLKQSWKQEYHARLQLHGTVRIAAVPGAFLILKSLIIPKVKDTYPNLNLRPAEIRGPLLLSCLENNQAELILGDYLRSEKEKTEALAASKGIILTALREDKYKIAVGKKRAPAKKSSLSLEETLSLPLACYYGGDAAAEIYLSGGAFSRENIIEYTSIDKMVQEAADGPGVSVLPELTIQNTWPDKLEFLNVEGIPVPFDHFAGYRRADIPDPRIPAVLKIIQDVFSFLEPAGSSRGECVSLP